MGMTYRINKTDGTLLTEIPTGIIDQISTDLTLIGNDVVGYGEFLNENFVRLLEHFSDTVQPTNPIVGQLWFDTSLSVLKVYDGNQFKLTSGPIVGSTKPTNLQPGDIWLDSSNQQLWFYDGVDFILVGPIADTTTTTYVNSRPLVLSAPIPSNSTDTEINTYLSNIMTTLAPHTEHDEGTIARILCFTSDGLTSQKDFALQSNVWVFTG
jgi:hypothetical protein